MSKGNFSFRYNRKINGKLIDLSEFCIDHNGDNIGLEYCINAQLSPIKSKNFELDDIVVEFNRDLTILEEDKLDHIITKHLNKVELSPIELIQEQWANSEYPIYEILPSIEVDLQGIYDNNSWTGFTFVEKRILSFWQIPTTGESIEVFSNEERESFRYYTIYKFLNAEQQKKLSKEDILITPKAFDFKIDFENAFYKKRFPFQRGRPVKKEYYASYDVTGFTYDDKFAEINFEFIDEAGTDLILQKIAILTWMLSDGSMDFINYKDIGEVYNPYTDGILRIEESAWKRSNIFDGLKANAIGMIAITNSVTLEQAITLGVDFIDDYKSFFYDWVDLGSDRQNVLIGAISNDVTHAWLDNIIDGNGTTIRMYIISEVQLQ